MSEEKVVRMVPDTGLGDNPGLVAMLRELLAAACDGTIHSAMFVTAGDDGLGHSTSIGPKQPMYATKLQLVGGFEQLKFDLFRGIEEDEDELLR